jgi:hypothetical protein
MYSFLTAGGLPKTPRPKIALPAHTPHQPTNYRFAARGQIRRKISYDAVETRRAQQGGVPRFLFGQEENGYAI